MSVRTRWLGRRFRSGAAAEFGAALLVSLGTREARAGGLGTSVTVEPIFRDVPPSEGWTDVLVTIENADDAAFSGTIESGGDEGASSPRVTHAVAVAPHGTKATRFPVRVPRYGHSPVVVGVRDARGALVARPISEADAQAVLVGYLADPRLLPELRFWVANQGVALNVVGNYKPILRDMLAREESEAAR